MLTTSAGSRTSIHSSKSAVSIRVLPSLRRVSRRCAPNGIFSVDSTASSDLSSLYSSSSDLSTTSEEDEWSDDDFEDPLWVKDDNLRRSRRRHQPTQQLPAASTSSLATSPSLVDQPRSMSDDNMVLEEDSAVGVEPEQLRATKGMKASMEEEEEAVLTPRKRARGRTPGKTVEKEEEQDRPKSKSVNKVKKRREQQTAAYREFAMHLDTSALGDLASATTTTTTTATARLAQRRCKAFSVNLTPRGGLFSSSSSSSSTSPAKISPQQRERERRKMEREVMTQRHQLELPHLQHQHLVVPPLSIPPATTNVTKKVEGNFWRKKMRGVKAYFSSSSSSSSPPASPGAPRATSCSPPPHSPTFVPLSCLSAHSHS